MDEVAKEHFGRDVAERILARVSERMNCAERRSPGGEPYFVASNAADGSNAGFVRLWAVADASLADRLIHFRLDSPPVETHLIFLFGRADTPMPHFHAQVVQFGPDSCVYNVDVIPRLDPVDHPQYFTEVFGPITRYYWKATGDRNNVCAMAPANPAVAAYLSPWGIGAGRPTSADELTRVLPSIHGYLDHCLDLAHGLRYTGPSAGYLRDRDRRHMAIFHSDELDPRAWKGVYRVIGEQAGRRVKEIFATPLR